jgi:NAD(P)-dependent dehydrogenase (short-subunit alcohol dehydrogenase family)
MDSRRLRGQAALANTSPMGRPACPDDIAMAEPFLARDDSSYMTGVPLIVDSGGTAR